MAQHDNTPRDLLFGLLALQVGLIHQDQLVAAFLAWSQARGATLPQLLVDRGAIDEESRTLLAAMAEKQIQLQGDPAKSLAAVTIGLSTLEHLTALNDPNLTVSLGLVSLHTVTQDASATISLGTTTSHGQRFRVLRPHAQGGLGAVFVALDRELNREVALKQILDHHADDPASRSRFLVEAEITGGLEHPGIVPVYGLGHHGDGRPYYAMRFIRGDSLKEAIAAFHHDERLKHDPGARSLALRKLLRRFIDVCNAIDYAHGRGVLHRDLKPGNVIVGKHGETLVVDWGLAKSMGHSEPSTTSDEPTLIPLSIGSVETVPGSAIGTPAYMSPEQAAGDLDRLGPRSDVYSLGATLFCLLTGKAPFEGTNLGAILFQVQKGFFPKPREFDPSIDRSLEAVCLKAMATNPEDRHANARALADDVERWAADEPTSAWREPASIRARRWMRRHRLAVTASAATLLMAMIGLASVAFVQARANEGLRQANLRETARLKLAMDAIKLFHGEASQDLLLKEKAFGRLRGRLLGGAAGFYGKLESLLAGTTDPESRSALAEAYFELGELTAEIGSKDEALKTHRRALELRQALASRPEAGLDEKAALGRSHQAIGRIFRDLGQAEEGMTEQNEALTLLTEVANARPNDQDAQRDRERSLDGLIHLTSDLGQDEECLALCLKALPIQQALALGHPDDVRFQIDATKTLFDISVCHGNTGRPADSLRFIEQARASAEEAVKRSPGDPEAQEVLGITSGYLGARLSQSGRVAEGLAVHQKSFDVFEFLLKDYPTSTEFRFRRAEALRNHAGTLGANGKLVESLAMLERARSLLEQVVLEDQGLARGPVLLGLVLDQSASLLQKMGRIDEARKVALRSIENLEKRASDPKATRSPLQRANLWAQIGESYVRNGQNRQGRAAFEQELKAREALIAAGSNSGADQLALLGCYQWLATTDFRLGQREEALQKYSRALSIWEGLPSAERKIPDVRLNAADMLTNVGYLHEAGGRPRQALEAYERAVSMMEELLSEKYSGNNIEARLMETLMRVVSFRQSESQFQDLAKLYRRIIAIPIPQASLGVGTLYNLACVHACLASLAREAGSGVTAAEAKVEADRSMERLRSAITAGYRNASHMKSDSDLDSLRSRADFQLLIMDLVFPARPFLEK